MMSLRTQPVFALGLVLVAALAVWGARQRVTAAHPSDEDRRDDELEGLRAELGALRGEVRARAIVAAQPSAPPAPIEASRAEAAGPTTEPFPAPPEEIQARIHARVAELSGLSEKILHDEAPDQAFTSTARKGVAAFLAEKSLLGVELGEVSCTATLCRVAVRHADHAAERAFTEEASQHEPFTVEALYARDEADPLRMTVYAARVGARLPH